MTADTDTIGWNIRDWSRAYRNGASPEQLLEQLRRQIELDEFSDGILRHGSAWISLVSDVALRDQLTRLSELKQEGAALPLYGVPFAVKDNIDVRGMATTAACPEYSYQPDSDATAVRLLREAGAIVLGKTNLDQFATGLVGTRSPYGAVANVFNADYIAGGSSSGSATAVAMGQVAFSLGTDTAGSGRVPAGFNHIVGMKASVGAISTTGVVP
ncbi:amidase family protein, partial [Thalassolituus sp.]|uniref:amidase family protein n=1 Tax=Thalassolituus sp. TaxID=2030822 RepID=UPI00351817B9